MIRLLVFLFLLVQPSEKQEVFQGSINIQKESLYESSFLTYHVKDNMVRIEEYDEEKELQTVLLADLISRKVIAMNPEKKVYKRIHTRPYSELMTSNNYEVIKTDYRRKVNGFTCYQWRVRNKDLNTEIAYWVINENFSFWDDLLKLLNNSENNYSFYLRIPNNDGFIPVLAVERTLVRNEKVRYSITNIMKSDLDNSLFEVPPDYIVLNN